MLPKIQNVLYATDLSRNSAYAFRYAVNTARKHDAKIHILHVIEPLSPQTEALLLMHLDHKKLDRLKQDSEEKMHRRIEERLKQFAEKELKDDPETLKRVVGIHIVQGDPATEILNKTDECGCDTIIMGTHGKGAISHAFLGSVSERVLRRIRKPVYIIPLPKGETDITLGDV
ncbi:MAG: universal stress protein [Deltaproteobacteria bacterium]|nr:universal stress protein [Deltaproteobacteria bacterium]